LPVEKRVGKDGKSYPAKPPRLKPRSDDDPGIEDEIDGEDPENYRTAFLLRVDQAIRFAGRVVDASDGLRSAFAHRTIAALLEGPAFDSGLAILSNPAAAPSDRPAQA